MRDNGVDMPDPEVDGGRVIFGGPDGGGGGGGGGMMAQDDPEFQAANEACQDHLAGLGGGSGPSGGG
jgi:hypothetical protein